MMNTLGSRKLSAVFVFFAAGYLLSSLLRGVTASLAPFFVNEFNIDPAQLGLLAGAYFASFAILQLPMGAWLDCYGVRRVLMLSLGIASVSCILFSEARTFQMLLAARVMSGIGVSACLIAPLSAARLWTSPSMQQRINAWMLMSGALGLVTGTLPAERIAAEWGWRPLFVFIGVLFFFVALSIAWISPTQDHKISRGKMLTGYGSIIKNPYTLAIGPLGFFNYAILVAIQTLWVGPWLNHLSGMASTDVAWQLMLINGVMLFVFLVMGYLSPKINKSADDSESILKRWTPLSIAMLFLIAYLGKDAGGGVFVAYCVFAWPLSVTHPLVGQRFPPQEAGRALAFFNLLLFAGVFCWQWGFGIVVKQLQSTLGIADSYRVAMCLLALMSTVGYLIFIFAIDAPKSTWLTTSATGKDK